VVEVALALVLVLASGLLMNSFVRMRTVDPGFEADGLVAMRIDLRAGYGDRATWLPFWNELLERTAALPGVQTAALSAFTPFLDFPMIQSFTPEGAGIAPDESVFFPSIPVSAGWNSTLGVRVLEGRTFDGSERADGTRVVMINRALADQYWPGRTDIVGRRLKEGSMTSTTDDTWYTVVGVTSDVRHRLSSEPIPTVYHPIEQLPWRTMSVLARVQGDPASVVAGMRSAVRAMDDALPIERIGPVTSFASESVTEPRFYSTLSAGFGILALILAVTGIYGTASWTTARRSREIGIRLTLGARPGEVRTMLTLKALRLALLGAAVGSAAALAGTRYLESYLFELSPTDPATFLATTAAVIGTAVGAAWLPARRAARMDPATILRTET
jgi:predicted permease